LHVGTRGVSGFAHPNTHFSPQALSDQQMLLEEISKTALTLCPHCAFVVYARMIEMGGKDAPSIRKPEIPHTPCSRRHREKILLEYYQAAPHLQTKRAHTRQQLRRGLPFHLYLLCYLLPCISANGLITKLVAGIVCSPIRSRAAYSRKPIFSS
jgi:hypothetical protein